MLIQSAVSASSAVHQRGKHASPRQGLTRLGAYPILTCMKTIALLLLEELSSCPFHNISLCPYCTRKHLGFS